ncbi:tetratricopeptide repeat protein [Aliikangiella coralliicola]|uniref:Tetratricopeptide repeat protein n=1 Tax=Aliikangiella coralliicola TaxID=2592383 RepID=A0A545TW07_9GAMM|nr:tetratricopeptide repeat protein [Aliikangiella coralliicola]TQV81407.1 tetratricopeptide repeat protein [Aliikangiella coralliicola]
MKDIKQSKLTKLTLPGITLSLGLLLSACAGQTNPPFKTAHNSYDLSGIQTLDDRQRADLYETIIAADMAEHNSDHLTAMSYYLYAAELSKNQQLIQKSIDAARAAKDSLGLEQAAKIWLSADTDNQQAYIILLEAQLNLNDTAGGSVTLKKLFELETEPQARYEILESAVINQDPRFSFSFLRSFKDQFPKEPAIPTGLGKIIFNLANANNRPSNMLERAMIAIEQALTIDPYFVPAIRIKSHTLYQLREDAKAVSYLSNLYKQSPDSKPISHMLGQLYYDLRNFKASANHFTGWIKEHPEDLEARYYQAASYYAMGQYHLSLAGFQNLLGQDYESQTVAFYCGDSANKTGEKRQAIACFQLVTEGKFQINAKIQLAKLLAESGKIEQALSTITDHTSLNEDEAVQLVGAEIDLLNQYVSVEKAKERLELAMKNSPDNLALLLKKIELYQLIDDPESLIKLLSQAKQLIEPGTKLDRFNMATAALLRNNGHYQHAVSWLNQAIEAKPDDKDLLYTRALYKEPLGLYDEMVSEFKYLLKLYPEDHNIQNALGYTLADLGKELDYAQQLIENAFAGLPDNPAVIDSKGWLAYRQGDLEKASMYLKKAFAMSPSAEGAAHLGEVLWQQGKQALAKQVWLKGINLDKDNKVLQETLTRLKVEM